MILGGLSLGSRSQPFCNVSGTYQKKSAQGMAIYGKMSCLLSNTGLCRIINLKTRKQVSSFRLGCYGEKNHANCASFGIESVKDSRIPVMYVSECAGKCRCFVESISDTSSLLVQTIHLDRKGIDAIAHDWVVDRKTKSLYSIARRQYASDSTVKTYAHRINRYRLPRLNEGKDVTLTDTDVLESFDVFFPNLQQGATIKGKYLYLPTGRNQSQNKMEDAERALIVVDLKTHQIARIIDLTSITNNEPEDCDFYKGKLLLYCGQSGGLYEIPYK